ncbi:hypothetical protein VTL71DRAFT_7310 [Oculimacula yallundae]|uniref:RRM domain-containing protein n=1 Tax=Oculimacula yallundae TaxID=86028 RepID=A0ABR4BX23_9HELO
MVLDASSSQAAQGVEGTTREFCTTMGMEGSNDRSVDSHPMGLEINLSGHNFDTAPQAEMSMTVEDLKAVHARVEFRIVNEATVARSPVTLGELFDALSEENNFDPNGRRFPHLHPSYFLQMTAADRAQDAWTFIQQLESTVTLGSATSSGDTRLPASFEESIGPAKEDFTNHQMQTLSIEPQDYRSLPVAYGVTSGFDMSRPVGPSQYHHNGMVYYGPPVPSMSAATDFPQFAYPGMFDWYLGNQAAISNDVARYSEVPVIIGNERFKPSPVMAPVAYLPDFQVPFQNAHSAALPPPATPLPLQFGASRHRLDERRFLSNETAGNAVPAGINSFTKYKGDFTDDTIRDMQCPEELNTSVHIEGFPANTSEADVLSVIRFAAVRNICIHPAVFGRFSTVAVDITFFTRESAEYCFTRGTDGHFRSREMPLKFMWNKNKCRPASGEELKQSRVLLIEGAENEVEMQGVERLLREKLVFKLIASHTWRVGDGYVVIWLEFAKLRGQARCAKKLIQEVITKLDLNVVVSYGEDPCGPR